MSSAPKKKINMNLWTCHQPNELFKMNKFTKIPTDRSIQKILLEKININET